MHLPSLLRTTVKSALPLVSCALISSPAHATRLWSDPATWSGTVPGPTTDAVISGTDPVIMNVASATVNTLTVSAGSTLRFSTTTSGTLSSKGNVIVEGTLEMKPASASVNQLLKITEANEGAFVGGGMSVLSTDKGLWVMETGKLDIVGTTKTPWVRAVGSINSGTNTITLASVPTSWAVNDQLVITPTGTSTTSSSESEERTITSISGSTVTLSSNLTYAHPACVVSSTITMTAEILNLTRNVRIEGMPPATEAPVTGSPANNPGRSHIFVHNMSDPAVHNIKYAAIRYMGPRQATSATASDKVQGRYALHFHHCGTNSVGSSVTGVVVRDAGSHAFVPHASHYITFTNCISYNTYESAYWWDEKAPNVDRSNAVSDGVNYNGCVAAKVKCHPSNAGYDISGFLLGIGDNTSITNCVATAVQGNTSSSGFHWPSTANGDAQNVWVFNNNVAHNNKVDGARVWQNDTRDHLIENFIAYRNLLSGVDHGAYENVYYWRNCYLIGNGTLGQERSNGWFNHNKSYGDVFGLMGHYHVEDIVVDNEGNGAYGFQQTQTAADATIPSVFLRWTVRNCRAQAVRIQTPGKVLKMDFVDWTVGTSAELEPADFLLQEMGTGSRIRVQRRNGTAYQITPQTGSTTTFDITNIPTFYP